MRGECKHHRHHPGARAPSEPSSDPDGFSAGTFLVVDVAIDQFRDWLVDLGFA